MTNNKYTIGIAQPAPPTVLIQNPDTSRHLLSIHPDGTVTGEIEDASEAARVFVEHIRGMVAQPTQTDALKIAREALHYAEQGLICYVENIDVATATGPEKGYALSFMILAKQCGNALAALEQSK